MVNFAREFLAWCKVDPGFSNSPDENNLRFWLKSKFGIDDAPTIAAIKRELGQTAAAPPAPAEDRKEQDNMEEITDEDIFGKDDTDMGDVRKRDAKGRDAAKKLIREIKPNTLQGRIIAFIMDISGNVNDVCREFNVKRNAVMSTLNVVSKNTGIGYTVKGENVTIELPEGIADPFLQG